MYAFKEQLTKGEQSEAALDGFFAQWYAIQPVALEQQRQGIDRIFTRLTDGQVYKVEYKCDWTAGKTHNAFVETVSVDTTNKPGWAYSSQADYLIYYIPGAVRVYVIALVDLRACLPAWRNFPIRRIPNQGYHTVGLLVPLDEFTYIATKILQLDPNGTR
jgi:hypothetical protein